MPRGFTCKVGIAQISGNPAYADELVACIQEPVFPSGDEKIGRELAIGGELNVKRYVRRELTPNEWRGSVAENPYWILDTVEMKTAWHPIGL